MSYAYTNGTLMRKNRIEKVKLTKGLCECCGKQGDHIHHIDFSKDNHDLSNLILLCKKCHSLTHFERKNKTSFFIREYGMTLKDLSYNLGGSYSYIYRLHKKGTLKDKVQEYRNFEKIKESYFKRMNIQPPYPEWKDLIKQSRVRYKGL